MKQRIAAGAIVIQDQKILMVRHRREGIYDFWVAPGGGVIGTETLEAAAVREVAEETALRVEAGPLMYVEEFWQPSQREVKFWFRCELLGGTLDTSAEEATREHIAEARFMTQAELAGYTVFPEVVTQRLWRDLDSLYLGPSYLGLREMEFY